ncbi:hypothetical protein ACE6H2_000290 [Prunus campanulata]
MNSIHSNEFSHNGFTLTEPEILEIICENHAPEIRPKFDVRSLFFITENIIKHSTHTSNILKNDEIKPQNFDNFISPLCALKLIGCEMSCKAVHENSAQTTTLGIFGKLTKYSWEAKAVLALAAFAMEYGNSWLLSQLYPQSDQLTTALAILNRVPLLLNSTANFKKQQGTVVELNKTINTTLQVIKCILKLDELSAHIDPNHASLKSAKKDVPINTYWSILTIVSCATEVFYLTRDEEKPQAVSILSHFVTKGINDILAKLKRQLTICQKEIDEPEIYWKLLKHVAHAPRKITHVFNTLILFKDDAYAKPATLSVGYTNKEVFDIDVLEGKYVTFYISTLDNVSHKDILSLKEVYEGTENNKCKIVWIPIVEDWTEYGREEQFMEWRSKMPWYAVQYLSPATIKYIKEEWYFQNKPLSVLMNPHGDVENLNALNWIQIHGINFFAFRNINPKTWIAPVVQEIMTPTLDTWMKEGEYIFFYGGTDDYSMERFRMKANSAKVSILEELKIHIKLFCVGKMGKGRSLSDDSNAGGFWSSIQSLLSTLSDYKLHGEHTALRKQVHKLLSYKNDESGWCVLSKGSSVVTSGHGWAISRVLDEFDQWKQRISHEENFGRCFQAYHEKVIAQTTTSGAHSAGCSFGNARNMECCPVCKTPIEATLVSYKCCRMCNLTPY